MNGGFLPGVGEVVYGYISARAIPEPGLPDTEESWRDAEPRTVNRTFRAEVVAGPSDPAHPRWPRRVRVLDPEAVARMGGRDELWMRLECLFPTRGGAGAALLADLAERRAGLVQAAEAAAMAVARADAELAAAAEECSRAGD